MTETLKACPCCGGTDIDHVPGEHICCRKVSCGVRVEMDAPWGGPAKDGVAFLVAAWNTRPQPTEKPLTREEVAELVTDAVIESGRIERELTTPVARIRAKTKIADKTIDAILARLPTLDAAVVERVQAIVDLAARFDQPDEYPIGMTSLRYGDLRALLNAFKGVGR
jgi:hypothetical protein